MKSSILVAALLVAGLLAGAPAYAQQASAPAGSSGQCKDGSYTSTASKRGACKGHKGVQEWYAASSGKMDAAAKVTATGAGGAALAPAAAPAVAWRKSTGATATSPAAVAAAGGGNGMVWVNGKVYHCQSDKWYGKTKHGSYMSEADAKSKGAHAEHGKACTP